MHKYNDIKYYTFVLFKQLLCLFTLHVLECGVSLNNLLHSMYSYVADTAILNLVMHNDESNLKFRQSLYQNFVKCVSNMNILC